MTAPIPSPAPFSPGSGLGEAGGGGGGSPRGGRGGGRSPAGRPPARRWAHSRAGRRPGTGAMAWRRAQAQKWVAVPTREGGAGVCFEAPGGWNPAKPKKWAKHSRAGSYVIWDGEQTENDGTYEIRKLGKNTIALFSIFILNYGTKRNERLSTPTNSITEPQPPHPGSAEPVGNQYN